MRVSINRTDQTSFARVLGIDSVESNASSVVRGGPTSTGTGVAAVLLLERTGCPALYTSGQGRLRVESPAERNPGVIGVDSTGFCGSNPQNQFGYTIYAPSVSPEDGGPRIIAQASSKGIPGVIASYAVTVGGNAGCCYPAGLSVPITGMEEPTSRRPADDRFNPLAPDPPRETVRTRHQAGYARAVTQGGLALADSHVTGCDPEADPATLTATSITVDCSGGLTVGNGEVVAFPLATEVKFIETVTVNGTLHLPVASNITIGRRTIDGKGQLIVSGVASFDSVHRLDIGGTPDGCNQGGSNCQPIYVSGTGSLRLNSGSLATTTCDPRPNYTSVATFGGTVEITGTDIAFCDTSIYVGTDSPGYSEQWVTTGGNCSEAKPCHVSTVDNARDRFLLTGGGSAIEWTAPDLSDDPPSPSSPFEGLALWAEGSGKSEVKGTAKLHAAGVFFLPNALFNLGGQGTGDNPRNAQFFARRLEFSGQGLYRFLPDPKDSVPTVIPGAYALIR